MTLEAFHKRLTHTRRQLNKAAKQLGGGAAPSPLRPTGGNAAVAAVDDSDNDATAPSLALRAVHAAERQADALENIECLLRAYITDSRAVRRWF